MYQEEIVEEVNIDKCPMKGKICWAGLIIPQLMLY